MRSAFAPSAQTTDVAHKTDRLPLYSASSASVTVLAPTAGQVGLIERGSGAPLNVSIVLKNVVAGARAVPFTPRNPDPESPQPRTLRADAGDEHRTLIAAR